MLPRFGKCLVTELVCVFLLLFLGECLNHVLHSISLTMQTSNICSFFGFLKYRI